MAIDRHPSGAVAAQTGQPRGPDRAVGARWEEQRDVDLILANRYGPVSQQFCTNCGNPYSKQRNCDNIGDRMAMPTREELKMVNRRMPPKKNIIGTYPGRVQRRKTMDAKDTICQ